MHVGVAARWLTTRLLLVCQFTYCTNPINPAGGVVDDKKSGPNDSSSRAQIHSGPQHDGNRSDGWRVRLAPFWVPCTTDMLIDHIHRNSLQVRRRAIQNMMRKLSTNELNVHFSRPLHLRGQSPQRSIDIRRLVHRSSGGCLTPPGRPLTPGRRNDGVFVRSHGLAWAGGFQPFAGVWFEP